MAKRFMVTGDARVAFVAFVEAEDEYEAIKKVEVMSMKELEAHGSLDDGDGLRIDADYAEEAD